MRSERTRYLPYAFLIAGIALFVFSNGRWIAPFAAWLAPVFLLRFVRLQMPFRGLVLLFVLMAISSRIMLAGIVPSLLGVLTYVLMVYYAVLWFFPYLMDKLIGVRISGFATTLVFPSAAVTAEYINTVIFGSWASVAYTQFDNLPFIQVSSVFGIWGVTFLIMWFASVSNWVLDRNIEWSSVKTGVLLYSTILSLALLHGGLRLAVFPPQSETVTVASFTATADIDRYLKELKKNGYASSLDMAQKDRQTQSVLLNSLYDSVFARNRGIISENVSITMWAETMIRVLEEDEADFISRGSDFARANGVYLLMAYFVIPLEDPGLQGLNKAIFIDPTGSIEWEYLKAYPVPGSTDRPGNKVLPISEIPFGRVSAAICYDMDFTGLIHQAGRAHADIMLVPAWDWKAIDPLHARMAVFRAIENGFSMVRQTGDGLSIATDYQGRTVAAMDHFTTENHVMISQVPVRGVRTIYAVIGDVFAWLCLAGLLGSLVLAFWRKGEGKV